MPKRSDRITIVDIANRAGVSFKSVSRVINGGSNVGDDLRERVERVMRELDYRPNAAARSLRGSRSYGIGLLIAAVGLHSDEDDNPLYSAPPSFIMSLQGGAIIGCRSAGYQLVIETIDLRSKRLAADLAQQFRNLRVDGVLLCPPLVDIPLIAETLAELDIPFVRILPGTPSENRLSIVIDDHAAAAAMTRHLIGAGHRNIGFISGPKDHLSASKRLAGFLQVIGETQGAAPQVLEADFTFDSGMRAGLDLLRVAARPTAVFAANDDMAAGVLAAAARLRLMVPNDLSVAGFDNSPIATLVWPPLTTVRQPIAKMAELGVEHLVRTSGIDALALPGVLEMPYKIVQRKSVAALPET